MPFTQPKPTTTLSPFRRFVRLVLRISVAIAILLLVLFTIWRVHLNSQINEQFARIRAAGLPVSPAEINTWLPSVPDAKNGALILTQAFTHLHELPPGRSNSIVELLRIKHANLGLDAERGAANALVQTNQEALAQIQSVFRYDTFRYPIDFSEGTYTALPHLSKLKHTAQILRVQTILLSEVQDPAWTNSVLLQLKLGETLNSEPTVVAYLVRSAILNIAAHSAEYALNRSAPEPSACAALQKAFRLAADTNTLPIALIGERAVFLPIFRLTRANLDAVGAVDDEERLAPKLIKSSAHERPVFWFTGFFERDLRFYLTTMENAISASRAPAPANLQLTNLSEVAQIAKTKFYIMSRAVVPALGKVPIKGATAEAYAKLAATAFAIESFSHAHDRLPESLKHLTPEFLETIPTDPFDGKPIRYRRLTRGYLLYSIGADGHDDGGKEPPAKMKSKDPNTYDITFTVER